VPAPRGTPTRSDQTSDGRSVVVDTSGVDRQALRAIGPGDAVTVTGKSGASPDRLFAHLALSEAGEQGQGTAWGEHVSDAEYTQPATGP